MPVIIIIIAVFAFLAAIILYRTQRMCEKPRACEDKIIPVSNKSATADRTARSLSELISFRTVSGAETDAGEFSRLYAYLKTRYPNVHKYSKHNTVSGSSLVYRFNGTNPALKPILFCAHTDVVPAVGEWQHPPFGGVMEGGRVHGRGAIDCKHIIACLMEAMESLTGSGYIPERDIFFAFGHDEEIGGENGAAVISKYFQNYKTEFEMVIDEGSYLTFGYPWLERPAAFIGVTEKGFLNVRLTAHAKAGHSSVPDGRSAVTVLSEAVCRITAARFPLRTTQVLREFFARAVSFLPQTDRIMYSNMWLFKFYYLRRLAKDCMKNAFLRTTTAPTVISGGQAYNVLPETAEAIINFRPLHGDTCSDIVAFIRSILRGLDVEIEVLRANDPSEVANYNSPAFFALEKSIRDVFGNILTSPYLCTAGCDARKYELVSHNVFRFSPFPFTGEELAAMHGVNESISISYLAPAVEFYKTLIENTGADMTRFNPKTHAEEQPKK